MTSTKWVYRFDEVDLAEKAVDGDWEEVRGLLGGKGANLGEMTRLGVPVPPGFTVTTKACLSYLEDGGTFPDGALDQVTEALRTVEASTGKRFGDSANPLLLSCRSGAKFSMPGMMDTVLNIGLNDDVVAGFTELTGDEHFVYDSYRRLIQMFGSVVLGLRDELFENVLERHRAEAGVETDPELPVEHLRQIVAEFHQIAPRFPDDPFEQLRLATEAVFQSWNGKRAKDYRNAAGIAHDLGTAVSIQTMVFGNMGDDSGTGVAMSRNATTGEDRIEGDYLTNAQGEDVVAGTRATKPIDELATEMPDMFSEFKEIARRLEHHYHEMQDMEFTIEHGKLWLLQTRDGKRTAQAAVRIAVEQVAEGLISQQEAVMRVSPEQVDFFLHPQFSPESRASAHWLAGGLNVSPGAAVGVVAFDADLAERWAKEDGRQVIMVRPETKPDDVHGMLAAEGILTSRGGRTSHAALVARQFGKPAVVGVAELEIDLNARVMTFGDQVVAEGDWISIDGTTGDVYLEALDTMVPDIEDPWLMELLGWADGLRRLDVRANADYPADAERARAYGAQGIGLTRTEHMFFEAERLPVVQRMIMAESPSERKEALEQLLPLQRSDFEGLFRAMDGLPVIIRLIDPPLHEFLPARNDLSKSLASHKFLLTKATTLAEIDEVLAQVEEEEHMLTRVEALHESNPMLGTRGVRLGIMLPDLTRMQVRAIFEAACEVARTGGDVHPEVMIPLTSHVNELKRQREVLEAEAKLVMEEQGIEVDYLFGTMIEIPRAALTAAEIAEYAEFFSFGTNDLTQTAFGISRDDAEAGFLVHYMQEGILDENPFATLDRDGVGQLMRMATENGRAARPGLEVGICGEHGGDPASIALCHELGLDYVSCSPFRVPIARLAAAQAAVRAGDPGPRGSSSPAEAASLG
ncbi:MAG: pyruvate, phosphate dikinase [Acidimicrobiia bacterium]|nr:pyruvate, phosphate dikinase [Acidimicrobiia bacterium]